LRHQYVHQIQMTLVTGENVVRQQVATLLWRRVVQAHDIRVGLAEYTVSGW
jgi:hypothetical protein